MKRKLKKITLKRFQRIKDKKLELFLMTGHNIATWNYIEEMYQTRRKFLTFRKRTFCELSTRYQKQKYNHVKKLIQKNNGLYYTEHLMEPNKEHSWLDIYFLSKKHKNVFYNVEVITALMDIYDQLENKYKYMFSEEGSLSFLKKEDLEKFKEEAIKTKIDFKVQTTFKIDKKYVSGIGLQIVINNGKMTFSEEEMKNAIQLFLENEEKDIVISNEQDLLIPALISLAENEFRVKFLNNFYEIKKQYIKNKILSKEEMDFYYEKNKVFTSLDEERDHFKKTSKIYTKIENDNIIRKLEELKENMLLNVFKSDNAIYGDFVSTLNIHQDLNNLLMEFNKRFDEHFNLLNEYNNKMFLDMIE